MQFVRSEKTKKSTEIKFWNSSHIFTFCYVLLLQVFGRRVTVLQCCKLLLRLLCERHLMLIHDNAMRPSNSSSFFCFISATVLILICTNLSPLTPPAPFINLILSSIQYSPFGQVSSYHGKHLPFNPLTLSHSSFMCFSKTSRVTIFLPV